jgi:hypothetical protein
MNERTESREMNTRINTLIMRGLTAAEARTQAEWELATPDSRPVWIRTCDRPGCVLTSTHRHGA